jgi:hypothetical protein
MLFCISVTGMGLRKMNNSCEDAGLPAVSDKEYLDRLYSIIGLIFLCGL